MGDALPPALVPHLLQTLGDTFAAAYQAPVPHPADPNASPVMLGMVLETAGLLVGTFGRSPAPLGTACEGFVLALVSLLAPTFLQQVPAMAAQPDATLAMFELLLRVGLSLVCLGVALVRQPTP